MIPIANYYKYGCFLNKKNVTPRYDQISISTLSEKNKLYQILSPNKNDQGVWIHQNAWFHIGKYDSKTEDEYSLKNKENGIYLFIIDGEIKINDQLLSKRDGMGLWNLSQINFEAEANSRVLVMEVPLTIN